ncbi:MAG: phytanoyl-CoA dioxygenase family protein [Flavobacteriaceae bacterium]|nr:phytanoyl-CoA dioxygenase family protein [Flavobacteriaceae bacterium]
METHFQALDNKGFESIPDFFTPEECDRMLWQIDRYGKKIWRDHKNQKVYAIRQLLKELPELQWILQHQKLKQLLESAFGGSCFLTKSLFFDKPIGSNWFVSYHQDLSISINDRFEIPGFRHWTKKNQHWGVTPSSEILEKTLTVRIHLKDTDSSNGALRLLVGSHQHGILRKEDLNLPIESCTQIAKEGDILLMRPLCFHASHKSINSRRRPIIHLEFHNIDLPYPLKWEEKILI